MNALWFVYLSVVFVKKKVALSAAIPVGNPNLLAHMAHWRDRTTHCGVFGFLHFHAIFFQDLGISLTIQMYFVAQLLQMLLHLTEDCCRVNSTVAFSDEELALLAAVLVENLIL